MKKTILYLTFLLATMFFVACSSSEDLTEEVVQEDIQEDILENISEESEENSDKEPEKEPEKELDKEPEELVDNRMEVENIQNYENVFLTDWLKDTQVLALKKNENLDMLALEELSDQYPTSIYRLDVETDEMNVILEKENTNLGQAVLSPNRSYILYSEYTLGDPVYYIYDLNTEESFKLTNDLLGGAMSAKWVEGNEVIGASYSGGIYKADSQGSMELIEGITDEMVFLAEKMGNTIFYNTNSHPTLKSYNVETQENITLPFEAVRDILASPSGEQLLILNANEEMMTLYIYDIIEATYEKVAESVLINGISFSPSGGKIAYIESQSSEGGGTLFVQDLVREEKIEINKNINYGTTDWSPSEKQMIYTTYDGETRTSSIVTFSIVDAE